MFLYHDATNYMTQIFFTLAGMVMLMAWHLFVISIIYR